MLSVPALEAIYTFKLMVLIEGGIMFQDNTSLAEISRILVLGQKNALII